MVRIFSFDRMIRRLQNRIAESRTALPVTLVYMATFMVIQVLLGHDTWLQMALLAISSILMAELNNANALIRIYSRMVSCSFIVMTTAANFLLSSADAEWAQMGLIVFFIFLLHAYQNDSATGWVFYAFAALSLSSIPFVYVLYLLPVLWIVLAMNIMALSPRTFLASLVGLMIPYWFIGAYAVVFQRLDWLAVHFRALAHPGPLLDLAVLNDHQVVTFYFLLILAAVGKYPFPALFLSGPKDPHAHALRDVHLSECLLSGFDAAVPCSLRWFPGLGNRCRRASDRSFSGINAFAAEQYCLFCHHCRRTVVDSFQPLIILLSPYYIYRRQKTMMDTLTLLLQHYGYWGMLLAAFLAGSFFPFSSEAVMLGLLAAGLHPIPLVVYGTIGNVAGSLFNYAVGRMGRLEWIERYLHVKKRDIDKAQHFMAGHGAWMGFFAFLPIIGSAITIALGLMRANFLISLLSITVGKLLRYVVLVAGVTAVF